MKHAYLIITHNEFEVLEKLLQAIDDERNDIYIHFDRKVKQLPLLQTGHAGLYMLDNRIDVRWGHVSQIKAEYALFEAAYQKDDYQHYHLISGTHLPLYSQNYIHRFFDGLKQQEVMAYIHAGEYEIDLKMQRYNLFMSNFTHRNQSLRSMNQLFWRLGIAIQRILHIHRNKNITFKKAANWVSITADCIKYLIERKKEVLKKYRFTMCGDEFFVPSELDASAVKWNILDCKRLIKTDMKRANTRAFGLEDYEDLINSQCLFARKFSKEDMVVVDRILEYIRSMK
jgi:hypothetical protein